MKTLRPLYIKERLGVISDEVVSPLVILDHTKEIFEISGTSLLHGNPVEFYDPIIKWIRDYLEMPNQKTIFTFKMRYFDTGSSKMLLDIMNICKDIPNIKIYWYYMKDDEDTMQAGYDFAEIINQQFEFIEI